MPVVATRPEDQYDVLIADSDLLGFREVMHRSHWKELDREVGLRGQLLHVLFQTPHLFLEIGRGLDAAVGSPTVGPGVRLRKGVM